MLREDVIKMCKENRTLLLSVTDNPEISQLIKEMTKPIKARIERIQQVCAISEYTLCFIGEVGVGKSTAIANLLGLTADMDNIKGNKLDDISLMPTAAGRTTACETTIILTENDILRIEIEKMEFDEFKKLVNQYADFILKLNPEESEKLPIEVRRIIKNMSGFPEDEDNVSLQEKYISEWIDTDSLDKRERLTSALLTKINYKNRNNTILSCIEGYSREWLKETLSELNKGNIEDVPYPLSVTIHINRKQIEASIPKFITKIKDTRGIDGKSTRDDITAYCNDIGSICILCDSITKFGNIVSDTFLRNQFVDSNMDIKYRNILLGLEKNNELEDVNDAGGREMGKRKKVKETKGSFQGIYFEEKNMLFYDSFIGLSYDNKHKITEFDIDQYTLEREAFFKKLDEALVYMYDRYGDELEALNSTLDIFKQNNVDDEQKRKLFEFSNIISDCKKEYTAKHNNVITELDGSMRGINASILRAAVTRKGEYWNYNLYSEVENFNLNCFDDSVNEHKYHIQKRVKDIFDSSNSLENAIITAIEYKIKQEFHYFRSKDSVDFREAVYNILIANPIWNSNQMPVWGDGKGNYRGRVATPIITEIQSRRVVPTVTEKQNIPFFYDSLLQLVRI